VIGGGAAGLSAAWALSHDPRHRWQIEVVQQGWRLGGKGRSGRLMTGPHKGRNVEHGIHVLFGFYHNVFTVLRSVYRAVGRPSGHPLSGWQDGLVPVHELLFRGDASDFTIRLPAATSIPGAADLDGLADVPAWPPRADLLRHLGRLSASAVVDLGADLRAAPASALRWRRDLMSLLVATARGCVADGLADAADHAGFLRAAERLENIDFRAWLRRHGASDAALGSAFIRTLYQLGFADDSRADAGTTLDGLVRIMLGYSGAPLYRLAGGMGDVVFAPWYEALRDCGVRFSFFHRVDDLRLSRSGDRVEEVFATVSAACSVDYKPLITVAGVPSWPDEPLWHQLHDGARLQRGGVDFESDHSDAIAAPVGHRTWQAGHDYDVVILAVPPAAQHRLGRGLCHHPDPATGARWRAMHKTVDTTATAMMHGWLRDPFSASGWPADTMAGGDTKPFDCWTDMSSALAWEPDGSDAPKGLFYACAALAASPDADDDPATAAHWQEQTRRAGDDWLHGRRGSPPFDPDALLAVDTRANLQRSDRYTRSVPGSRSARLAADQSGVDNLFIAGDWTRTGLDAGCVEAAVMSGLQAARAICGYPRAVVGEHPTIAERAQLTGPFIDQNPPRSPHAQLH